MRKLIYCIAALTAGYAVAASADGVKVSEAQRPCPQWWKDAKFGIFVHWGVYSVPAFAPTSGDKFYSCYSEHYRGRLQNKVEAFVKYHEKTYPGKSYVDLASQFTAENWKPVEWAELFRRSGAKYVVLTSKHHDGYSLWPSAQSPNWNSMELGPKRDICGELTKAVRDAGLRMGFYYSLFEYSRLAGEKVSNRFVDDVNLPQLKDIVLRYSPEIVWGDGHWRVPKAISRADEFFSWLYNESPVKDTVVVNDRWWSGSRAHSGDFYTTEYDDTGTDKKEKNDYPWEECRGIGRSFGYNRFERAENYLTDAQCIETLCDKVSRGGNFLLNVGPDATGHIPPIMEERLLAMGKWLAVNGEAIYGTSAWEKRPRDMKKNRVYFTRKGDVLYAIVFGSTATVTVPGVGKVKDVQLVGRDTLIVRMQEGDDVKIIMPAFLQGAAPCEHALVFKLILE